MSEGRLTASNISLARPGSSHRRTIARAWLPRSSPAIGVLAEVKIRLTTARQEPVPPLQSPVKKSRKPGARDGSALPRQAVNLFPAQIGWKSISDEDVPDQIRGFHRAPRLRQ